MVPADNPHGLMQGRKSPPLRFGLVMLRKCPTRYRAIFIGASVARYAFHQAGIVEFWRVVLFGNTVLVSAAL
jgi:hypothetical protein